MSLMSLCIFHSIKQTYIEENIYESNARNFWDTDQFNQEHRSSAKVQHNTSKTTILSPILFDLWVGKVCFVHGKSSTDGTSRSHSIEAVVNR